jgi:hypothetical protein
MINLSTESGQHQMGSEMGRIIEAGQGNTHVDSSCSLIVFNMNREETS